MKYNIYLVSLGCSKNLVDSEQMLGQLGEAGYRIVQEPSKAHVIIVNTCAFIDDAKQEAIDEILKMAHFKGLGSCRALIVAGCLAQRFHSEIFQELPEVDAVVGVFSVQDITEIIDRSMAGEKLLWIGEADSDVYKLPRMRITPHYMSYLKIAEGCSNRCTYCVIPSIRGAFRSYPHQWLVRQAEEMERQGISELSIIAQDTTRYGEDLYGERRLPRLLEDILQLSIPWVRLHYCYPDSVTDQLLRLYEKHSNLCGYIDMPIQHVSKNVLKRMGRRDVDIRALLRSIRDINRKIIVRTSLIVGFPGETEEDYLQLLEFVKEGLIDRVGVFKYSREEGTPAFDMDGQVDEETVSMRHNEIVDAHYENSLKANQQMIGQRERVLIEDASREGEYIGRTQHDAAEVDHQVHVTSHKKLEAGEYVSVTIDSAQAYDLYGHVEKE